MNKIEGDILEGVQLEGITKDELDNMSNYELKEFQRRQSDEKIQKENKNREFYFVSTLFFIVCMSMLLINPIFTLYLAIAPAVAAFVFAIKTLQAHINLDIQILSRRMLESFYESNEL